MPEALQARDGPAPDTPPQLLIAALCDAAYAEYLPFLAYSVRVLAPRPALRIYAPGPDTDVCSALLQRSGIDPGDGVTVRAVDDYTTAQPDSLHTLKALRFLIDDPDWARYDGVYVTDVDMTLTDPHLLETRLAHARSIQKPYSNLIRVRLDRSGRPRMQGVHFLIPSRYLDPVRPTLETFAGRMNRGELANQNDEVTLAEMLERAFGLPGFRGFERRGVKPFNPLHGVHLRAFARGGYSDARQEAALRWDDQAARLLALAADDRFHQLVERAPAGIREQVQRATGAAERVVAEGIVKKRYELVREAARMAAGRNLRRLGWAPRSG